MKNYEFSLEKFRSIEGVKNAYMKDGELIGFEKGVKIGEIKGREEGREEGREIGMSIKSREIAERLLKKGHSVDEAAELTELSADVVLEIWEELKKNNDL